MGDAVLGCLFHRALVADARRARLAWLDRFVSERTRNPRKVPVTVSMDGLTAGQRDALDRLLSASQSSAYERGPSWFIPWNLSDPGVLRASATVKTIDIANGRVVIEDAGST